jgi:HD-like signal output (HDOD) protein
MKDEILKKVKAFPPLDDTIVQIQKICMDKNSSLNDLVKVVESDPMLTANILKSANSPLYGFSREIKNISHAVSLFGMATVRGFALSSAIKHNIKIDLSPYGISSSQFLNISASQSGLMINWYSKVSREMMDILVPASFLMEIGKIIVANELISSGKADSFASSFANCETPSDVSELERELVELSSEEVASMIFDFWNLEKEMVEAIKYSTSYDAADDDMKPYAIALNVVKEAVNIKGAYTDAGLTRAESILATNELDIGTFKTAVEKVSG